MRYSMVAGWTAALDFNLYSKGITPSGTMASMTVQLILKEKDTEAVIPTTGDVTVQDSTNWVVRYLPDSTDLVLGIYRARFKVTDLAGLVSYFPSEDWDIWDVRSES